MSQLAAEEKEADPTAGFDVATAIKLQRQAVMTGERTLGLHHPETIGFYFNLAMLENVAGDQTVTLRLFRHILHLWDVVYGRDHPELPSILVSLAVARREVILDVMTDLLRMGDRRFTSPSCSRTRTVTPLRSSSSTRSTGSRRSCSARPTSWPVPHRAS